MKSFSSLVRGFSLALRCAALASAAVLASASVAQAGDAPFANMRSAGSPMASAAAGAATAPAAQLQLEADGVAFGMSSDQVARLYDRWWDRHFVAKYRKANPGPKTRELDYQLEEQKKTLRRVTNFDGRTATYDKSEFREEFGHGNGETMTSTKVLRRGAGGKAVSYTRRFFFFQDKLWKIYDEYRLDAQSPLGADFKQAIERVAVSLGPTAKRSRGPASRSENVLFDAGSVRVRLIDLAADRVALVRADSALTKTVLDGRARNVPAPEGGLDEDTQAALR